MSHRCVPVAFPISLQGVSTVALGSKAFANMTGGIAIGFNAKSTGLLSISLGSNANAVGMSNVAIGGQCE